MRQEQLLKAELYQNEYARILQDNHSSCKILHDSYCLEYLTGQPFFV